MSPIISTLSNNWTSSGGSAPLILPGNDDELYYIGNAHSGKINSSYSGYDWSITHATNTSFPATMADVIEAPNGQMWAYTSQGNKIKSIRLSDGATGSAYTVNQTIRGLCTSRNGYAVVFNSYGVYTYSINNLGAFSQVGSAHSSLGTVESCVAPPPYSSSNLGDKSNLGSTGDSNGYSKIAFVDQNASGGSVVRTLNIGSDGAISNFLSTSSSGMEGFVSYYPNGDIALLREKFTSSVSKLVRFSNGNVSGTGTVGGSWSFPSGVDEQVQHFQPTPSGSFVASFRYNNALTYNNMWESNKYTASDPYAPSVSGQSAGDSNLQYVNGMAFANNKFWWNGYDDGKTLFYRSLNASGDIDWSGSISSISPPGSWASGTVGIALVTGRPKWAEFDHALNQW